MTFNWSQIRDAVWSQPDPFLMAASVRGEILVAKIRLWLTTILLLIPLFNILFLPDPRESLIGLSVTTGAFLISLAARLLVDSDHHRPWLGFVTGAFDVTLVSGALASFLALGMPHTAVNSKVVFEGYFLAFAATTLRYDKRVCLVSGLLAIIEYFFIVLFASTHWQLNDDVFAPFIYGAFSWSAQISRMIIMLTAAAMSLAVVARTQQLLKLSTSDPLTKVFNRGYFDERIGIEISRATRYGQPLTVAMVDVDHFKSFNDDHGHGVGDTVLQMIAGTLRQSFRKSDIVARYGGEEFVIAMPETEIETAYRKLEELRLTIASTPIQVQRDSKPSFITISAGLAGLPVDMTKDGDLVGVAGARLFQAKRNGRNQIVRN